MDAFDSIQSMGETLPVCEQSPIAKREVGNAASCNHMSRLTELSSVISTNTNRLQEYFVSAGLPMPSFDIGAPVDISLPPDVELLRERVLDASTELNELLLGPRETMVDWQFNYYVPWNAILQYKLAQIFPVGEEASFEHIAEKSGLSLSLVRRLLRHAIANRIFKETRKGVVAHTATSQLLSEDPLLQAYVGTSDEMLRATAYTVPAIAKHPGSQEPGHTGFSLAEGSEESFYQVLAKDPKRAKRFMKVMEMKLKGPGFAIDHIAGYELWHKLPERSTVVDIGGSHGEVAIAIAQRVQSLNLIVQDMEVANADHSKLPEDLNHRVTFMTHDFFTPQPVNNADAYLLRWILHNWPDKYCLTILRSLIPALKPGARIIVNEFCLPEPNSTLNRVDRRMRLVITEIAR